MDSIIIGKLSNARIVTSLKLAIKTNDDDVISKLKSQYPESFDNSKKYLSKKYLSYLNKRNY